MVGAVGIFSRPPPTTARIALLVFRWLGRLAVVGFAGLLVVIIAIWAVSLCLHIEYRFGLNAVGFWSGRVEAEWGTLSVATTQASRELGWHIRTRQPDERILARLGLRWPEAHLHHHGNRPWGDVAIPLWAPAAATLLAIVVARLGRKARGWRDVAMATGVGVAWITMGVWIASMFLHVRFETGLEAVDMALLDGTLEVTSGSSNAAFSGTSGPYCTWTNVGYHIVIERRDSLVRVPWGRRIGARLPESISAAQVVRAGGSSPGGFALPMWCVAIPAVAFAALMVRISRGYIAPGHCRRCGYDLTANISGVCPECGRSLGPEAAASTAVSVPPPPIVQRGK